MSRQATIRRLISNNLSFVMVTLLATAPYSIADGQFWDRLANPKLQVPITHPPDVMLKGVTKIAVLGFSGEGQCGDEFAQRLSVELGTSGQFEVIDRTSIAAIMQEQGFQNSGAFNSELAVKLGELVGPAAIMSGRVTRCNVEVSPILKGGQFKDSNGRINTRFVRRTTARMVASVNLIDLTTAKVYAGNLVDITHPVEHEAINAYPEPPSADAVLSAMYERALWEVKKMILPWAETVSLTVFKDGKCQLNESVDMIKRGDLQLAVERLTASLEQSCGAPNDKNLLSKARYNLGVALAYSNRPEDGLRELQTSSELRSTGIANDAIAAVRKMISLEAQRRAKEVASVQLSGTSNAASEKAARSRMTNQDVIGMVKAKLSDAIVIAKINSSNCTYDTTPAGLIALKESGASDTVLLAVTQASEARCK
jgi:hypothetical protein